MRPQRTILLMGVSPSGPGRRGASVAALLGPQSFALGDVLVPRRRAEAVLDLHHRDAVGHGADDLAEVAADALFFVDDGHAQVPAGAGRRLDLREGAERRLARARHRALDG